MEFLTSSIVVGIGLAISQQAHDFSVLSSALALVFVQNDFIEGIAKNFGLAADIDVAPVSCTTDHDHAALGRHAVDGRDHADRN